MVISFLFFGDLNRAMHILGRHGYCDGDSTFRVDRNELKVEVNPNYDNRELVEKFLLSMSTPVEAGTVVVTNEAPLLGISGGLRAVVVTQKEWAQGNAVRETSDYGRDAVFVRYLNGEDQNTLLRPEMFKRLTC